MSDICCRVAASCRFVCPLSRRASHKAPLPGPSPGLGICLAYHTRASRWRWRYGSGSVLEGECRCRRASPPPQLPHRHNPNLFFYKSPTPHSLSVPPISSMESHESTSSYDFGAPRRVASPSPTGVFNVGLAPAQLPWRRATSVLLLAAAVTARPDTGRVLPAQVHERMRDFACASAHRQEGSTSGLMAATPLTSRQAFHALLAAAAQVLEIIRVSGDNLGSPRRCTDRRGQAPGVIATSPPPMAKSLAKSRQSGRESFASTRENTQEHEVSLVFLLLRSVTAPHLAVPAELDATPMIAIDADTNKSRYEGAVDLHPDFEGM